MPPEEAEDVSPHVRIRVHPEQKREWLEYADNNNLSLTDLIKDSVENTISDEWVLASEAEADLDLSEIDFGDLEEDMEEVKSTLEAFKEHLDTLTVDGRDSEEFLNRGELLSLAERVQTNLPVVNDGDMLIEMCENVLHVQEDQVPWFTGRAIDIARTIGEPEGHVRQTLIWLESDQQVSNVSSIIHEGERRWYEVDPHKTVDEALEQLEDDLPDDAELEFSTAAEIENTGERSE